jgi:superoxide dismutase
MDNTKLVTAESSNAELIEAVREWDTHHRVHPMMRKLADRLEAAEAELTRRDTVITGLVNEWREIPSGGHYNQEAYFESLGKESAATELEDALAAAPVSLEAVKAEAWAEGHDQALANLAWPKERKSKPYLPASTEGDNRG